MDNEERDTEHLGSSNCYASLVDRLQDYDKRHDGDVDESVVAIGELLEMLKRFAVRGEQLWDDKNFRDGYKKISSGDLVDCRNLLRQFGITDFDA